MLAEVVEGIEGSGFRSGVCCLPRGVRPFYRLAFCLWMGPKSRTYHFPLSLPSAISFPWGSPVSRDIAVGRGLVVVECNCSKKSWSWRPITSPNVSTHMSQQLLPI